MAWNKEHTTLVVVIIAWIVLIAIGFAVYNSNDPMDNEPPGDQCFIPGDC
jgi:hypothetical protein